MARPTERDNGGGRGVVDQGVHPLYLFPKSAHAKGMLEKAMVVRLSVKGSEGWFENLSGNHQESHYYEGQTWREEVWSI